MVRRGARRELLRDRGSERCARHAARVRRFREVHPHPLAVVLWRRLTTTTSTRGGTWKSLGITEFDPTPTSHVYQLAGTYYIDLTIGYRAEYSFNGSTYAPIMGTLWLPANRLVATVGSAKTVLVERDCVVNPTGPGCSN